MENTMLLIMGLDTMQVASFLRFSFPIVLRW